MVPESPQPTPGEYDQPGDLAEQPSGKFILPGVQAENGVDRISVASEEDLEEALRRHKYILPLIRGDKGATLETCAEKAKKTARTIRRWRDLYEKAGIAGLMDRQRGGAGQSRAIRDDELKRFAIETALRLMRPSRRRTPPVAAVLMRIAALAPVRGWQVPSRYALRRLLWAIPRRERIYMAEGDQGYLRDVVPKPPVRWAATPNEAWVGDWHQLDLRVKEGYRPWVALIKDRFDGCVLGFAFSRTPNSMGMALAFRMAVLAKPEDPEGLLCGLPLRFYTDLGKDLRSKHIEAVLIELGVEHPPATGYRPWTRGDVESTFGGIRKMFIQFLPGHVGNRPDRKPVKTKGVFTLAELYTHLRAFILAVYNKMPRDRRRIGGAPVSRLDERRSVLFTLRLPKQEELLLLLLKRERRQVGIQVSAWVASSPIGTPP